MYFISKVYFSMQTQMWWRLLIWIRREPRQKDDVHDMIVLQALHMNTGRDFQKLALQNAATWLVGCLVTNTEFSETETEKITFFFFFYYLNCYLDSNSCSPVRHWL